MGPFIFLAKEVSKNSKAEAADKEMKLGRAEEMEYEEDESDEISEDGYEQEDDPVEEDDYETEGLEAVAVSDVVE